MLKSAHSPGYTLIELLITISIMAILSTIAFVNFKDFAQEGVLNRAVGQVQTLLRLAQTNATTGLKCNDSPAESWMIEFETNQTEIQLKCKSSSIDKQALEGGVTVDAILTGSVCSDRSLPNNTMSVVYSNLSGKIDFVWNKGKQDPCIADVSSIKITLKGKNSSKSLTVFKGGAIDIQ